MALLANSLEGGSSGTTISNANSGGASGNALDTVSIGSSATLTFDNTHAAHGTLAMSCSTPAVATSSFAFWGTSLGAGQTQVWFRVYLYATAAPGANTRVVTFWTTTGGATLCGTLLMNTAGKIIFQNAVSGTILTSAATFPLNAWFRVEGFIIPSATVGQLEFKVFTTMDSVTPSDTQTSAATLNTGASVGSAGFGASNSVASAGPFWMDDLGVSTTGYMGPAATSANVTGVAAQVPVASPAGTPAGSANVTGTAAPVTVVAGLGTPAAGAAVTGAAAAVSVQSPAGTPSGGAKVTGTAAAVPVGAGTGTPAGSGSANVTGAAAAVATSAGLGTPSGGAAIAFTVGLLAASDAPGAVLTAASAASVLAASTSSGTLTAATAAAGTTAYGSTYGPDYGPQEGTLTATDQRTGGPG